MKDVARCDKPWGGVSTRRSADFRMGQPTRKGIPQGKRTWGTETSQYPEERTSTETPLVVASERGRGQ
jgi:hypothetical protein